MGLAVACFAERDQVIVHITSRLAPQFHVVNLQILPAAADLAPPVIAFKDLATQSSIGFGVESVSGSLGTNRCHDAFPFA